MEKLMKKKLCSFMGKMMLIILVLLVIASSEIFKAMWVALGRSLSVLSYVSVRSSI